MIAGAFLFYQKAKYSFVDKKIQQMVTKETKGLYKIAYDSMFVDEIGGNITLTNITLQPDTIMQLALLKSGDTTAAKMMIAVKIPLLKVIGFKTARALLSKQLVCSKILIQDPQATILIFPSDKRENAREQKQEELYRQILGNLKELKADSVLLVNAGATAIDYFNKKVKFQTSNTNVVLADVRIDSANYFDKSRTLFSKAIYVHSDRTTLGEAGHEAKLTNMTFDTDSKKLFFSSLEYVAHAKSANFKGLIKDASITGLEWKGAAEYSDLNIDKVEVDRMDVDASSKGAYKSSNQTKILTGWIQNFRLNTLQLNAFNFHSKPADPNKKGIDINNSALAIKNLHFDTTAYFDERLMRYVKELELSNSLVEIVSEDKLYKYIVKGIKLNTRLKRLTIDNFKIQPQLSENAFAAKSKVQKDRFDLNAEHLVSSGLDIGKLASGSFFMDQLAAAHTVLKVYRDLNYPSDGKDRLRSFPQQILMKMQVPMKIKLFTCNDANVYYREENQITDSVGEVPFRNASLRIQNVKNVDINHGDKTVATFTTLLLNALPMKGTLTFFMDKWKEGNVQVQCAINKPFHADVLNKLTVPMALTRIDKGDINSISCDLLVDNMMSKGIVKLIYEDLKISLLKMGDDKMHKKNAFSLIANILVKNSNKPGATERVANVSKQRDPSRSFFNFTWKSIFEGGTKIMGVKVKQ
jgi:hypothetical protein